VVYLGFLHQVMDAGVSFLWGGGVSLDRHPLSLIRGVTSRFKRLQEG